MNYLLAGAIGLLGGISSGLFGVGGGIVMVPAMVLLMKTKIEVAIGTSLVVIVPTAFTGAFKHSLQGNLDWRLALALAPLALLGGWTGAWLTTVLGGTALKRLFGLLLIGVGTRLLFYKG